MPKFSRRRKRRFRRKKMSLRKVIKKVIISQAEKKFHDLVIGDTSLENATPFINFLSQIPVGTSSSQRIGDNVDTVRLRLRYNIRSIAAGQSQASVRVMVFQQLGDDAIKLTPQDVEQLWPVFKDAETPYKVLHDRTYDMGLGIHSDVTTDITIRSMKKQISYSGTTTIMGELVFRVITDNVDTDALALLACSRLYYTDS